MSNYMNETAVKLREFQARVKELGGSYCRRYAHADRTKYYLARETDAFVKAGVELGLVVTVEANRSWIGGKSVFVAGVTMKKPYDGNKAPTAEDLANPTNRF